MHNAPDSFRCFLAAYPDAAALASIADFIGRLKSRNPTIRWEKREQLHITIKFIGEINRGKAKEAVERMKMRLHEPESFGGVIDDVGAFPHFRRPRIIWLGFSDVPPNLPIISSATEDVWESVGVPRERGAFKPHFTIGRVKERSATADLEKDISACSFSAVPVWFESLRVMESKLTPAGAIHGEFARIDLRTPRVSIDINNL